MTHFDYDIVVLGGGAAGLTASGLAASLGAKTALVERERTGGECTWTGCVPSKALLKAAAVLETIRRAGRYGLGQEGEPAVDFRRVMEWVRSTREKIYEDADAPEVIRGRNIDLIEGEAAFIDPHTIVINGDQQRTITGRYFIICTGSSPVVPQVAGLPRERLLTNSNLFELDELPARLAVIGGGSVGVEMAQAFRRFGSQVSVVEQEREILFRDEPECAALLRKRLEKEGIHFYLGCRLDAIARDEKGYYAQVSSGEQWTSIRFDMILAAAGRRPNIEGLGLDAAGVIQGSEGIKANHSGQTSVSHIYACGDVVEGLRLTHMAENMAKTAVMRLLLKLPATYERRSVPWVTFTDPESAHLGKTSAELAEARTKFETIRFPYSRIDRAVIDGADDGMILLHISPVSGKLYGAHIVGAHAGEMINELALAMHHGLSLRDISGTVHAYPTYLLGVRRASDQWYIRQGSPRIVDTLRQLFGYRGKPSDALGSDGIV